MWVLPGTAVRGSEIGISLAKPTGQWGALMPENYTICLNSLNVGSTMDFSGCPASCGWWPSKRASEAMWLHRPEDEEAIWNRNRQLEHSFNTGHKPRKCVHQNIPTSFLTYCPCSHTQEHADRLAWESTSLKTRTFKHSTDDTTQFPLFGSRYLA